jgi:hypothetical protein
VAKEVSVVETVITKLEQDVVQQLESDQSWALEQPFPTVEQATDHVMIPLTRQTGSTI